MNTINGQYKGKDVRIGIVVSRFNEAVTGKLLEGAIDALTRHEVKDEHITTIWTPGAFEIPATAQRVVETNRYEAVICLGAVIRGDTPHFDYIAAEVTKGIAQVSMTAQIPVIFGVLTTDTVEQAVDRAGAKAGNKGFNAALAALEMISLYKTIV